MCQDERAIRAFLEIGNRLLTNGNAERHDTSFVDENSDFQQGFLAGATACKKSVQQLMGRLHPDVPYQGDVSTSAVDLSACSPGYRSGYRAGFVAYQAELEQITSRINAVVLLAHYCEIEELDLTVRIFNIFKRENVHTIGDLISLTAEQLLGFNGLGKKQLEVLRTKLRDRGMYLAGEDLHEYRV